MLRFMRSKGKRTKVIWWSLIIITTVTFLGGFVFILGSGLNSSYQARVSGALGVVEGIPISRTDYQTALANQREAYKRQYGADPAERDNKVIEVQTWRRMVVERMLLKQARELGIKAHDHEVVVSLQTSPPPELTSAPALQTDGKFDPAKYQSFMTDPNYVQEVARLEELTRRQLPVRKLQERLLTSVKLSEPELREAFRNRFERLSATVVHIPGAAGPDTPAASEADLDRLYSKYKSRFSTGVRCQLEVLMVPKTLGEPEIRAARELAQSLAERARSGEDFAGLAEVYSTGPGADAGGLIDRDLQLSDFGGELGPKIAAMEPGDIADPIQDGSRFLIFKLLEKKPSSTTGSPSVRLAQIVIRIEADGNALREQYESLVRLRDQAAKIGLGRAAAAQALATAVTGYYDFDNAPPELFGVPEAADWGLTAKVGDVSPVYEGIDEFAIVQVATRNAAGPVPRDQVTEQLRQLAQLEAGVEQSKPKADQVAQALAGGQTLEQAAAAAAAGLPAFKVDGVTRIQQDARIAGAPEFVGALFAAQPGTVVGPIRTVAGWYFGRPEFVTAADSTLFEQVKGQISSDMLQRRQQTFLSSYLNEVLLQAKVKDLRREPVY